MLWLYRRNDSLFRSSQVSGTKSDPGAESDYTNQGQQMSFHVHWAIEGDHRRDIDGVLKALP
jgi:hypothetical protein